MLGRTGGDAGGSFTGLPAHCLNVFVPLVDVSAALGPTDFVNDPLLALTLCDRAHRCRADSCGVQVPGSHRLPAAGRVDAALRTGGDKTAELHRALRPAGLGVVTPLPPAGSAILYDHRLVHRGTENTAGAERPMLYLMYARREHAPRTPFLWLLRSALPGSAGCVFTFYSLFDGWRVVSSVVQGRAELRGRAALPAGSEWRRRGRRRRPEAAGRWGGRGRAGRRGWRGHRQEQQVGGSVRVIQLCL